MKLKDTYVSVIIPAAGMGRRMNSSINKQFMPLRKKPVLAHTIEKFIKCDNINEIIVVIREDERDLLIEQVIKPYNLQKVTKIVTGGEERKDSVYNGLLEVNFKCEIVVVHDGARPFVNEQYINNSILGAVKHGACVVGVPVKDTIKIVNRCSDIVNTPNRETLWAVQTPQTFSYKLLLKAYQQSINPGYSVTDDSMLVEKLGHTVKMIKGSYDNIKITTPEDIILGERILEKYYNSY